MPEAKSKSKECDWTRCRGKGHRLFHPIGVCYHWWTPIPPRKVRVNLKVCEECLLRYDVHESLQSAVRSLLEEGKYPVPTEVKMEFEPCLRS